MLNYLSLRLSLLLRLRDPFRINQAFAIAPKLPVPLLLQDKVALSPSLHILRFSFQDEEACLGNTVGQYFSLSPEGKPALARPFYPLSPIDSQGIVTFLHRHVPEGELSKAIMAAQPGSSFVLDCCASAYTYHGRGVFRKGEIERKLKRVGLVCSGAAVSSFAQLIYACHLNRDRGLSISLLHLVGSRDDLVFAEELLDLSGLGDLLQVTYVMTDEVDPLWPGLRAFDKQTFQDFMPEGGLVLCAGNPKLRQQVDSLGQQTGREVWQV